MQDAKKMIREKLQSLYPPEEIESFISMIFSYVLGFTRLEMHLRQTAKIPEAKLIQIAEIVNRLAEYEPIQYVLGETEFFGLKFKVSPAVLIPRPETEELVDWILKDKQEHFSSFLDVGTGSGCIPVAIAKSSQFVNVEGWDISEEALLVARKNAKINNVPVVFFRFDIFKWHEIPVGKKWDIIASNPPYVMYKEKELMNKNVTDFEPHLALFVPDKDPLIFYREIIGFASKHLNRGGHLYFEINEKLGLEVSLLLQSASFTDIVLRKDINGKDRMVRAINP
jgi:release factor glutamine methyltransferase